MLLATAFLPVEEVPTAFELLQGMASEESQPIFNYFEDTYIGRLTSQGRQKPKFDMEQWSCHQRVKNDLPRTNNAVEGWNSNFVKLVNSKHPSFPKLIEKFQDEQKNAEILLEKMCAGQKLARPKKAKYQKLDKNLITMIKSYQPNDIIGFLKGCSYNIKL